MIHRVVFKVRYISTSLLLPTAAAELAQASLRQVPAETSPGHQIKHVFARWRFHLQPTVNPGVPHAPSTLLPLPLASAFSQIARRDKPETLRRK